MVLDFRFPVDVGGALFQRKTQIESRSFADLGKKFKLSVSEQLKL